MMGLAKGRPVKDQQERWQDEASFFDKFVAEVELTPIDPITLARYQRPVRKRYSTDYRISLAGDVRGKTILDVGCGEGTNSILLAKLGARVTGIDISPKSIELARKRAEINQVTESCRFVCGPLETTDLVSESFDIIWGDAILHHVIPDLDMVLSRLTRWAKPDAVMIFGEPVNFNQTLRRIRFMIPVKTDVSPDERPLEFAEIAILRRYIPDFRMRHFLLLARLARFVLVKNNYEKSSWVRRAITDALAGIDVLAFSIPGMWRLGGHAVLYGRPKSG